MRLLKYKIRLSNVILLAGLLMFSCNQKKNENKDSKLTDLSGPYLGQELPGTTPKLFAPGIVSTDLPERDLTISPDGNEIYFTVQLGPLTDFRSCIVGVRQINGYWTKPEVVSFSGQYSDIEPFIQPDGKKMYFASRRPLVQGVENKARYSIWYVDRIGDAWGTPKPVGEPITGGGMVCYASITKSGTMYFTKMHEDGNEFIYRSKFVDGKFTTPEILPKNVNINDTQWNAFISPDEDFLIVPSYVEGDSYGSYDYYVSFRDENDNWSDLINLGEKINSPGLDFTPSVSPDGKYFFFQRMAFTEKLDEKILTYNDLINVHNGRGDIYWVDASVIHELNPFKKSNNIN
jgi:hypothetical protein